MAQGRMIQRRISQNKDLPRLLSLVNERMGGAHGAQAVILYTWCIAHLDVEGRMHGDPAVVKGTVVPRFGSISETDIDAYLLAMGECGLVIYYEAKGDRWLVFPGFNEAQPGMRKDRESLSKVPLPEEGRILAGVTPAECRQDSRISLIEENKKGSGAGVLPVKPRCTPGTLQDTWLSLTGKIAHHGLTDVAIMCEDAAAAQDPPIDPNEYLSKAVQGFVSWVAKCPADRRPQLSPQKFVEHFARIQGFVSAGGKGKPSSLGALLAQASRLERGE